MIRLKDNQRNILRRTDFVNTPDLDYDAAYRLLEKYSGLTLKSPGTEELFSFQPCITKDDTPIWTVCNVKRNQEQIEEFSVQTSCIMGVICISSNDKESAKIIVEIGSRFDENDDQFFLTYLLSKVLQVNFSAENIKIGMKNYWHFLLCLMFINKLAEASSVGLYREYITNHRNDMHFSGTFDVERHLQENIPLAHGIAYSNREITFDNPINHLLRSAIRKIELQYDFLWRNNHEATYISNMLKQETPSWVGTCWETKNRFPLSVFRTLRHPFYSFYYEPLRVLAIMLLNDEGLNFYNVLSNSEINGLVFNGADIWEDYLFTILLKSKKMEFIHPNNRTGTHPHFLYANNKGKIFPDFISKDKQVIIDAKYKHLDCEIQREDRFQLISYLHTQNSMAGFLMFPTQREDLEAEIEGTLNGEIGGDIGKIPFHVRGNCVTYKDFVQNMQNEERGVLESVYSLYNKALAHNRQLID